MQLRDYQQDLVDRTQFAWLAGMLVVCVQLATGGGKTPILSSIIHAHNGFIAAIAHRDKLVEQMSLTLARAGVRHDIIASEKTKKIITKKHVKKLGQCFLVPGARVRVCSVDTLKRAKGIEQWAAQVTLWIVDEGHHVLKENKWGKALAMFTHPHAQGLLLTATPGRPDGKGLSRHRRGCNGGPCEGCGDGLADILVEGPAMRWLIDEGYLCDYKVLTVPTDLRSAEAPKGSDGDFTHSQRVTAERASHIVGDVPHHYLTWTPGLSGVTFAGSIETAGEIVKSFRERGVPAELITGDTDPDQRDRIFDKAERGEIKQIVAVDVISEGVDIPALQVGSFARLTGSHIVWLQQIGRILRPDYAPGFDLWTREGRLAAIAASKKPFAWIIDHISGFTDPRLGPPDKVRVWSIFEKEARQEKDEDDIPNRVCGNEQANGGLGCWTPYPRTKRYCPVCGWAPEKTPRMPPEHVDGDLALLDEATLNALRGNVVDLDKDRDTFQAEQLAKRADPKWIPRHWENFQATSAAQRDLRDSMDRWGGILHARGLADYEIQRRFFLRFGTDVLSAQASNAADAKLLKLRIDEAVKRF